MEHRLFITLESESDKTETYNKAIAAYDNYNETLSVLTKAREELLLLAEEANYRSARWHKEHITPIDELLKKLTL